MPGDPETHQPYVAPRPGSLAPSRWLLPDPEPLGDPGGLVGVGADLEPETLADAYRRGIFPWPHPGTPLPWFSPDPRAIVTMESIHLSRTLRRHLRACGWHTTVDACFDDVVEACSLRPRNEGTWITRDMRRAYGRLQRLGWAHSIEVWNGPELAGGIYGVRVGGCFTGESMFHRVSEASKVALADLVLRWHEAGGAFVDVQLPTDHLTSMGAVAVPRGAFLRRLASVRDCEVAIAMRRCAVSRLDSQLPRPAGE